MFYNASLVRVSAVMMEFENMSKAMDIFNKDILD